jgi:hypothetical protein
MGVSQRPQCGRLGAPGGSAFSTPVFPIIGLPPKMHDRKYENSRFFDGIENRIGKPVQQAAMNVVLYERPGMWVSDNVVYCGENFDGEIVTESGFTIFIVFNSRAKLLLRFGVK